MHFQFTAPWTGATKTVLAKLRTLQDSSTQFSYYVLLQLPNSPMELICAATYQLHNDEIGFGSKENIINNGSVGEFMFPCLFALATMDQNNTITMHWPQNMQSNATPAIYYSNTCLRGKSQCVDCSIHNLSGRRCGGELLSTCIVVHGAIVGGWWVQSMWLHLEGTE